MITARQTRLFRVPDLRAFQRTIRRLADHSDPAALRSCAIIVPTEAAADQLRRTFENHSLQPPSSSDRALLLPLILTRTGFYDALHARLATPPRRISDLEREVLLRAAARDAAAETPPPFRIRPGLLIEMLGLYDELQRRDVSVDAFQRLLTTDLERDAEADRGAERLLGQTRFLAAAFRGYEARRDACGVVDESGLRKRLLCAELGRPLRHVIVTVAERAVDGFGLWPADFDLLTRLPLLERVDIVATHATIAAGFVDRLQKFMPGYEEAPDDGRSTMDDGRTPDRPEPVLLVRPDRQPFSVSRDREEELSAIARRLKTAGGCDLDRYAIVFKRPLPYVYLARDVFGDAGIPYQTFDALPLAAEPYAAALDLVVEFVLSEFTRETVIALLGSPHFHFEVEGTAVGRSDIASLNRAYSEAGYFGGFEQLHVFARTGGRAALAAAAAADELQLLSQSERPSVQLDALLSFLARHDRIAPVSDPLRERSLRARRAIHSAIHALKRAHAHLDDSPVTFIEVAATIRRWIEAQTFAPRTGTSGLHLLDAQAARYGEFDEIVLVGLIEDEWPQRSAKSIFYPPSLLNQLDWPDSRMALAGERAAFQDLLTLARLRVSLSSFELENDSIVSPSVFLEHIDRIGLRTQPSAIASGGRVFVREALTQEPVVATAVGGDASVWLKLRSARTDASAARFHGAARPYRPPAYSVSSLERYLQCPFRFFAERVLDLQEDPEDEATLNPKELGIFVHEVFQAFFEEWGGSGQQSITPENLPQARSIFRDVVEPLLARLPEGEAAVYRARLFGSAAGEGLAEAVFQVEAEWETPVVTRLLEHPLSGEFDIEGDHQTRRVALRGKADRIDLLADGTFRIIDYKLGYAPDRKLALQLPIYSVCAAQHFREASGSQWEPGQAGYIAFGGDRRFIPMLGRGQDKDATLRDAQNRLLTTIDAIERGEFPPAPAEIILCNRCAHAAVCRKEYVGDV